MALHINKEITYTSEDMTHYKHWRAPIIFIHLKFIYGLGQVCSGMGWTMGRKK
jgi:hypothetical protein